MRAPVSPFRSPIILGFPRSLLVPLAAAAATLVWLAPLPAANAPPRDLVEAAQAAGEPVLAFTPTDDSYISADFPTANYGSRRSLRVDNDPVEHSLLKFSVGGVEDRSVVSATLWLYCKNEASLGGSVFSVPEPQIPWSEDTVTWNNAPAVGSEPVASLGAVAVGNWYPLDLTPIVSGDGVVNLRVTSIRSNGADYMSKEARDGLAPLLVVTMREPLPDTTPPTTPTNLAAAAIDPTNVALTWNESIDDVGVAGYEVFRDGALLATTPPVTGYTDPTTSPSTSYEYSVRAIDTAGNPSGASNTATVTTPGIAGPITLVPVADSFVDSSQPDRNFGGLSQIRTDGLPDVHGLIRFEPQDFGAAVSTATLRVFANSSNSLGVDVHGVLDHPWEESSLTFGTMPDILGIVNSSGPINSGQWIEWDVTSLASSGKPLTFGLTSQSFTATSFSSRESANPPQLVLTFQGSTPPAPQPPPDTTPPSAPTNLSAVAASSERIDLAWTASTDAVGVTGYRIYRNGSLLTSTGPLTTYPDTTVAPDTTYEYSVRAHDEAGNVSDPSNSDSVTTPALPPSPDPDPTPGSGATVAAAGDIACDPLSGSFNNGLGTSSGCRQAYTAALLSGADAVLTLGDTQYENGAYDKFLLSYDRSWGAVKSITYPAVGNHEYLTPGALGYFTYFGSAAGTPGQGWYSFNLAGWHIVSLNSNCSAVGGCGPGSPQYSWLMADLAANNADCTLAYWHHPRFSSGNYGNHDAFQPFWQLLYNDGAEIVLAGHDHNYQRYAPQTPAGARDDARGVREFVVGTGGKTHYAVDPSGTNRQAANGDTYGVLKLTLGAGAYDWRFVPEEGKTYTDSGTDSCH
jgi:acid phosphatase type 7